MNPTRNDAAFPLIWDISRPGRNTRSLPPLDVPETPLPDAMTRNAEAEGTPDPLPLPDVSELDLVRHYTRLSQANFSIDTHFYPLGSCTMKYNPKVHETAAALPGLVDQHPQQPPDLSQGSLELLYRLQNLLAEISGYKGVSLQPAAGAQGELTGVLMIRAYHLSRGDTRRKNILIPDSAHGTNPATVTMAGYSAVELPSDSNGNVDLEALRAHCNEETAGLMITNPNTLGLFEEHIEEVVGTVHSCGGLVYGDGANLNALTGILRPGDVGIDVMHFNLHKTFSTPHGGGGPGAGPVGAGPTLVDFLPGPVVTKDEGGAYRFIKPAHSIGRMKSFYGNFGMLIRAFTYILMHGPDGLRSMAENAVLNANYLKRLVEDVYPVKYSRTCMHEFVAMGTVAEGVHTKDIAKRLLDYGFHAPTVYFPLIVKEALMIEPTESETRETIEAFAHALLAIAEEARNEPDLVRDAPHNLPVMRLDETKAAKELVLRYEREAAE
ncbi:MAG: aminomethyl-transferring glycine dehydrogenase subunit GcvPB [Spirochaetaceae bacterium]